MRWLDLAFAHWPVPAEALRPHVPPGLELDTWDGTAWLGVVPFRMSHVAPRFVPPVPGLSAFPELNLRTYVRAEGKPGVWFFSLDVPKRLPVWVARTAFHLPYFLASMRMQAEGDGFRYESERRSATRPGGLVARYRPTGDLLDVAPGSLDEWLTERYCLYSADRKGRVYRGDVHHARWPLQPAAIEVEHDTLATPLGLELSGPPERVHFARRIDVVAWGIERVG